LDKLDIKTNLMKEFTASYKPLLTKEVETMDIAKAVPVVSPSKRLAKVLILTASFVVLLSLLHDCDHGDHSRHHEMNAEHHAAPNDSWSMENNQGFNVEHHHVEKPFGAFDFGSWFSDSEDSSDSESSDSESSDSESSDSESSDSKSSDSESSDSASSDGEDWPHGGPWHWLFGGHHHHKEGHHGGPPPPLPPQTFLEGVDFIRAEEPPRGPPPPPMTGSLRGSMIVRPPGVLPPPPLEETVSTERRDETTAEANP
jgi:hypothetical protein